MTSIASASTEWRTSSLAELNAGCNSFKGRGIGQHLAAVIPAAAGTVIGAAVGVVTSPFVAVGDVVASANKRDVDGDPRFLPYQMGKIGVLAGVGAMGISVGAHLFGLPFSMSLLQGLLVGASATGLAFAGNSLIDAVGAGVSRGLGCSLKLTAKVCDALGFKAKPQAQLPAQN